MARNKDNVKVSLRNRTLFFALAFLALIVVLFCRLFYWQVIKSEELKSGALNQQTLEKEITPRRGTIYDRNGEELAVSASVETVTVSPEAVKEANNAEDVAITLSEILGMDKEEIMEIITRDSQFAYIAKKVDSAKTAQIRKYITGKDELGNELTEEEMEGHDLSGISLVEDTKRFYPGGNLAAHVIGFTGTDNQGLEGIEAIYDKYLKGKSGKIVTSLKSSGNIPSDYEKYYDAQDGNNIVLTVDANIQYIVEKVIDEVYLEHKPANGCCIMVTNPNTGEILAMATRPTFDLNSPRVLSPDQTEPATLEELQARWRNKAVVDTYEPGSVFKLITCAIALEEKVTNLTDAYYCPGYLIVGGQHISCFQTSGHGASNLLKGTVDSCNPVYMQVVEKIGKETMFKYFKSFGFRETTGFDLPGEAVGAFWNYSGYNETELATSSFGQGFTVTPLQMATAVGSLVNGGYLYKPFIVKEIVDSNGNVVESTTPTRIRQVISKETSETMRYIMQTTLVESGSLAKVEGYDVGGKSGTSEQIPRGNNKYIGSYCSVAPINDPQLLCLVMVDDPRGVSYYGGQVAAPAASKIMGQALKYYNIESNNPEATGTTDDTVVPDVTGKSAEDAKRILASFSLSPSMKGSGDVVTVQEPAAGTHVRNGSHVLLTMGTAGENSTETVVPGVIGKSAEEVNTLVTEAGLTLNAAGTTNGQNIIALSQQPAEGTKVEKGSTVTVTFGAQ